MITDEMVERACSVFFKGQWPSSSTYNDNIMRDMMRGLLGAFEPEFRAAARYRILRLYNLSGNWPRKFEEQGVDAPAGLIAWTPGHHSPAQLDRMLDDMLGLREGRPGTRPDYKEWRAACTAERVAATEALIESEKQA